MHSCLHCYVQGKKTGNRTQDLGSFLIPQRRITIPTEPDENCFFRAISLALFGGEDYHEQVREKLVQLISTNKEVFERFCPSDTVSLDEHLQRMQQVGIWVTHLEIHAVASLLQIPVYICTQRSKSLYYYWELYKPKNCTSPPKQEDTLFQGQLAQAHLEIAHVKRCHYEVAELSTPWHEYE